MSHKFQFTSVETILNKFARDLRGTEINEYDVIAWTGEALSFMKVPELQQELVIFLEVKDHKADFPCGFQQVIQIARNNNFIPSQETPASIIGSLSAEEIEDIVLRNEVDSIEEYYPYLMLQIQSNLWQNSNYFKQKFTPVRLANNNFFGSIVSSGSKPAGYQELFAPTIDEYSIAGCPPNLGLVFSFREGQIALAYYGAMVDLETGYPLLPDYIHFISAISYYVKWKIAERLRWNGREGMASEAEDAEKKWLKYCRQAINRAKMPQGVDDYQDLMEQSIRLIPKRRTYYGYFGNLGREEDTKFNNPDGRRKFTTNRYIP